MLFMVIERFRQGNSRLIGERFKKSGRMLPDGVAYHASWVDAQGTCCFQIMEAAKPEMLTPWVSAWSDLIDFEIVPVLISADYWAQARRDERG